MKKTIKDRTKARVAKATAKTGAKVKKAVRRACAALAVLAVLALDGCMHPGEQAAKSETMNVTIRDSVIAVNIGAKKSTANCTSNTVELAEGDRIYDVTILSQAQSLASSGTESFSQTQTPTQDVKPNLDVRYNDAIAGASTASKGVLSSIGAGIDGVLSLMQSKRSGAVQVTKTDGTAATVKCENGQCAFVDCDGGVCAPQ